MSNPGYGSCWVPSKREQAALQVFFDTRENDTITNLALRGGNKSTGFSTPAASGTTRQENGKFRPKKRSTGAGINNRNKYGRKSVDIAKDRLEFSRDFARRKLLFIYNANGCPEFADTTIEDGVRPLLFYLSPIAHNNLAHSNEQSMEILLRDVSAKLSPDVNKNVQVKALYDSCLRKIESVSELKHGGKYLACETTWFKKPPARSLVPFLTDLIDVQRAY